MFGFLAFLGPVGIGAAIIGTAATAAYAYMKDDEKSSSGTNDTDSKHREATPAEQASVILFLLCLRQLLARIFPLYIFFVK